jgi:hypothetical protein
MIEAIEPHTLEELSKFYKNKEIKRNKSKKKSKREKESKDGRLGSWFEALFIITVSASIFILYYLYDH